MITLVKMNPAIVPVIFYDGTNLQDFIDMWGYDNIEGHNGCEFSITFNEDDSIVTIPIYSYVLNYLGVPIVLNKMQFLGLTDEYFGTNEEGNFFFLTRDEIIEKYYITRRANRNKQDNYAITPQCAPSSENP